MRLPDLEAWAIFATVAEHRSFTAAAEALGLSKATISKAISRLEADLGQSLFHRTSRRLALTEAGKPLADHAALILASAYAAEEAARDGAQAPAGRIRMAAPMTFGVSNIAPLLTRFLAEHPGIEVELHLSDARVDIVAEGFDVALSISCSATPISSARGASAAPAARKSRSRHKARSRRTAARRWCPRSSPASASPASPPSSLATR